MSSTHRGQNGGNRQGSGDNRQGSGDSRTRRQALDLDQPGTDPASSARTST